MSWTAPHVFSVGEILTAANMNLIQGNITAMNGVGDLKFVMQGSGGVGVETAMRAGWLECNGAVVSRATYSALSAFLAGLTPAFPFGSGDGSTTFGLPDLRGRYPVHVGGHADVSILGNSDGTADSKRRPKHRHTVNKAAGSALGSNFNGASAGTAGVPTANGGSFTVGADPVNDPLDAPPYLVAGVWVIKF